MEYQYDLAISLLEEDAQLGWDIVNKLDNPDKIFFYKKDVDELTFKNGGNVFGDVFSENARFILVLFREKYGKTDWTALEYSLVQDRFIKTIKTGDSPILFCKLDKSNKPSWLPETYIYSSISDLDSLIRLIRKRITDQGGVSFPQSAEERLKNHIVNSKYEESFLSKSYSSQELADEARTEAAVLREKLYEKLRRNAAELAISFSDHTVNVGSNIPLARLHLEVGNAIITLKDEQESINSIFEARLRIILYQRSKREMSFETTERKYKEFVKCYYVTINGIRGWRDENHKYFLTTDGFVETIFHHVVNILTD